jgi:hypothetical protein
MVKNLLIAFLMGLLIIPTIAQDTPPDITLPISMYLLVDDIENPNLDISTSRTEDGLMTILENMNIIWSQSNIELSLNTIATVEVPEAVLEDIIAGDFSSFFAALADGSISLPDTAQINGFYAKNIGGPNGITLNNQVYFVNDEPTVNDERVSSHEIGHMLGLHHHLVSPNRLMYSGTNGTTLSDEEIIVTRYFADGFLQGLRR